MTATLAAPARRELFIFGGRGSSASAMERTALRYSATSNRWASASPMRYARGLGQAVTVGELIYVLGGCRELGTGLDRAEAYNPASDSWRTLPNMPESLHDFGAIAWRDSLIFILGGGNWMQRSPPRSRVLLYDPAQATWDSATPLPVPLGATAAACSGDTVVVVAGWAEDGPTNALWLGLINPGNPREVSWQPLDTIPGLRRYRPIVALAAGVLHIIGGTGQDHAVLSDAWSLHLWTGEWSRLPSAPRPVGEIIGLPLLGQRLYLPAGLTGPEPYSIEHHCLEIGGLDWDVGADSVVSPAGRLEPFLLCPVQSQVTNYGAGPTFIEASATITDTLTGLLLFDADLTTSLDSGETRLLDFGDFAPPANSWFLLTVSTRGLFDQNPDNDTIRHSSRTTTGSSPDGHGYAYFSTQEPDQIAFDWIDPAGATPITDWRPNADDGASLRRLPFPFPFYGEAIQQLYLCTDGFLQSADLPTGTNRPLPYFSFSAIIAPFWDDLTLTGAGAVLEQLDSARAVYTWANVPRYGTPADTFTFQVALHASGRVSYNYLRMIGDRTSSTVGIQGKSGTWNRYLQYVFDGAPENHIPADSTSILFSSPLVALAEPGTPVRYAPTHALLAPSHSSGRTVLIRLLHSSPLCAPFSSPAARLPSLDVYDITGRLVRNLLPTHNPQCASGRSELVFRWDMCDRTGRRQTPGTYVLLCRTGAETLVRKLVLTR